MQTASIEKRDKFQAYYTPAWAVFELLNFYKNALPEDFLVSYLRSIWLEPCAGDLAITKSIAYWCGQNNLPAPKVYTNDIDKDCKTDLHLDATSLELYEYTKPFLTISNPPYGKGMNEIVHNAVASSTVCCMFVRLSFLEPTKGRKFLTKYPPSKVIVLPRYCFSKSKKNPDKWGTDPLTCGWIIWDKNIIDQRTISIPESEIKFFYKNPDQGLEKFKHIFV